MADLIALSPELRTLVTFLAVDCRPTAIFGLHPETLEVDLDANTVYLNNAFNKSIPSEEELVNLRGDIRRTQTARDRVDWHGSTLDGQRWQTSVCDGYLVAVRIQQPTDVNNGNTVDGETAPSNRHNGSIKYSSGTGSKSGHSISRRSQDWTQYDDPGLSPWIKYVRNFDWAATSLGPMSSWSPLLRHYVVTIMANPNPRLIVWGPDMTFVYNEACVPLWGEKHPAVLGKHTSSAWSEAWQDVKPLLDAVYGGETRKISAYPLSLERNGYLEETYWESTLLPIFDTTGDPIGIFDELADVTAVVTGERRRISVAALSQRMSMATTLPQLWNSVLTTFKEAVFDVPFALLYSVIDDVSDAEEVESHSNESWSSSVPKCAKLIGTVGVQDNNPAVVDTFGLLEHIETGLGITQACLKVWRTRESVLLSIKDGSLPLALNSPVPGRNFDAEIRDALISPIKSVSGDEILGILIIGLNSRCLFEDEYQMYIHMTVNLVEKAAALISLPEAQQRAKKIADDVHNALIQQLRLTTLKAERSEAKFSRLAASAPTGMFMLDIEGRPLYVNDTYMKMLGHTKHEEYLKAPVSTDWKEQVHEDDFDRFSEAWARMTEQKTPFTLEYRLKRPWSSIDESTHEQLSGETWLLATAFPEIEADGTVSTIQGWLTDISHRKFSENMLKLRLADALEHKRQTENFIDMTSHEMRNPLSAILQSADAIVSMLISSGTPILHEHMSLSAATAEDVIDAAQTIILCAQHQKRIVDDILTLSKLDASLLVISPDKVQAPAIITKALKMYEAEIERAGIEASVCLESSYNELGVDWVLLDPSRLLQVIINLLTNSIKFTQYSDVRKIKICLGASYEKPSGKHHGISFIPTKQSRTARSTSATMSVSEDEIYLQFAVYDSGRGLDDEEMKLIFSRFQQANAMTYSQYGGTGLGLFISRELCELQGGQIGVASRKGSTVFTFYVKVRRWQPEEGEEQTAAMSGLRKFSSAAASPIAFSRRGSSVLQELTSQMSTHTLECGTTIETFTPASCEVATAAESAPDLRNESPSPQGKAQLHVLLVEDNLINQKVMSKQLRRAGCEVHVANHGLECLAFLEKSSFCVAEDQVPLHLILLDLEMPTMDGLTCIKHIRERQLDGRINSHVPVIAVTANARQEQIEIAIEAGMDQVVTKPFRIAELLPTMDALVAEIRKRP